MSEPEKESPTTPFQRKNLYPYLLGVYALILESVLFASLVPADWEDSIVSHTALISRLAAIHAYGSLYLSLTISAFLFQSFLLTRMKSTSYRKASVGIRRGAWELKQLVKALRPGKWIPSLYFAVVIGNDAAMNRAEGSRVLQGGLDHVGVMVFRTSVVGGLFLVIFMIWNPWRATVSGELDDVDWSRDAAAVTA